MATPRSILFTCALLVALVLGGLDCYAEARLVEWRVPLTAAPTNLSGNSAGEFFELPVETSVDGGDDGLQDLVPMNLSGNVASPMNLSGNSAGDLFEMGVETTDIDLRNAVLMNLSGNVVSPMNLSGNVANPMNLSGNSAGELFEANARHSKSLHSGHSLDIANNMPAGHVLQVHCINENNLSEAYLVDQTIFTGESYHWEVPTSHSDNTHVKYRFSSVWKGTYPQKHVDVNFWEDQNNRSLMPFRCTECFFNMYDDGLYLYDSDVQHFVKLQGWDY